MTPSSVSPYLSITTSQSVMEVCKVVFILSFLGASLGYPQSERIPVLEDAGEKTFPGISSSSSGLQPKLKPYFPEDQASREDEGQVTRSARESPPLMFRGPHSTKVCIYVSPDHQGSVICGPQVDDNKDVTPFPSARYMSPYQRTLPSQGPTYPFAPSRYASPAARGPYPLRRTEDGEDPLSPSEEAYNPASAASGPQQQLPVAPPPQRLIPSSPSAEPHGVIVHRQFFQAPYPGGLIQSPLASLLKLNCAVDPVGGFLPAPAPAVRYYPLGEQVVTLQDGSPAKFGANVGDPSQLRTQNPFALPQGRRAYEDTQPNPMASGFVGSPSPYGDANFLGAPSPYPYTSGMEADMMKADMMEADMMKADMMLGRSAGEPWELSSDSYAEEVARRNFYLQEDALRQTNERIQLMENHLKNLEKFTNSSVVENSKDSAPTDGQSKSPQTVIDVTNHAEKRHAKSKTS